MSEKDGEFLARNDSVGIPNDKTGTLFTAVMYVMDLSCIFGARGGWCVSRGPGRLRTLRSFESRLQARLHGSGWSRRAQPTVRIEGILDCLVFVDRSLSRW